MKKGAGVPGRTQQKVTVNMQPAAPGNQKAESTALFSPGDSLTHADAFHLWLTSYRRQLERICEREIKAKCGTTEASAKTSSGSAE